MRIMLGSSPKVLGSIPRARKNIIRDERKKLIESGVWFWLWDDRRNAVCLTHASRTTIKKRLSANGWECKYGMTGLLFEIRSSEKDYVDSCIWWCLYRISASCRVTAYQGDDSCWLSVELATLGLKKGPNWFRTQKRILRYGGPRQQLRNLGN